MFPWPPIENNPLPPNAPSNNQDPLPHNTTLNDDPLPDTEENNHLSSNAASNLYKFLPDTQENNNPSAANEISTAKDVSSKLGLNY